MVLIDLTADYSDEVDRLGMTTQSDDCENQELKMAVIMSVQKWPFQICAMSGGEYQKDVRLSLNAYFPGHLNS